MSAASIHCLCGAVSFPLECSLPAPTELCHCNPCRHTSGALFAGWTGLLDSVPESSVLNKCTVYHSSKTHDRYFCSTCGTKLFIHAHTKPDGSVRAQWFIFGGAIDPSEGTDDVLKIERHEWLTDTRDGGIAPFLTHLGNGSIPCYETDENSAQLSSRALDDRIKSSRLVTKPSNGDTLTAECRCGGVSLRIQRAAHDERHVSQLDRFIPKDSSGEVEHGKHIAFVCVCRYCRLHMGVSLAPWVYVPPIQVINPHTAKPVVQHRAATTGTAAQHANKGLALTYYWSSDTACRSFCNVCGAAVFYSNDRRQEIVNVAAGLLRAEEGVMARNWLSWQWGRTSWKDESTQKDVMEAWQATEES